MINDDRITMPVKLTNLSISKSKIKLEKKQKISIQFNKPSGSRQRIFLNKSTLYGRT
jgi:hypothetical protein